jgi:hypothetical protein
VAVALNTTFGTATNATNVTTRTPPLPTNWAIGQLGLSILTLKGTAASATVSAGWTLLGPFRSVTGTTSVSFYAAHKILVSGEAAPTFTITGNTTTTDTLSRSYTLSDAAGGLGTPGTLYQPTGTISGTGASLGPVSGVPVPANSGVVLFGAMGDDFVTPVAPTGWTTMGGQELTTNGVAMLPFFQAFTTAGTSANTTITAQPSAATLAVGVQIPVLQIAVTSSLPVARAGYSRFRPYLVR